jgi:hypothetical protein
MTIVWEGTIDGVETRIQHWQEMNDCTVLEKCGDEWDVVDDDSVCAEAYMRAFLETRMKYALDAGW